MLSCVIPVVLLWMPGGKGVERNPKIPINYDSYHQACKSRYHPSSCAIKIILKPEIGHTSVICSNTKEV